MMSMLVVYMTFIGGGPKYDQIGTFRYFLSLGILISSIQPDTNTYLGKLLVTNL